MSVVTCALCGEDAECVGNMFICQLCSSKVTAAHIGRFIQIESELVREKAAAGHLAARMTKLVTDQDDRVAGMMSEHQLVKQELSDRISSARKYLRSIRRWPYKEFVDGVVSRLNGEN